jgi:hypothetical protein
MQDFNNQKGLVARVLTSSVRVTLTSGPRVGQAKTFPPLNLSKVAHTGMAAVEHSHAPDLQSATNKRAATSGSDDEHPLKKTAHAPASPNGDLV